MLKGARPAQAGNWKIISHSTYSQQPLPYLSYPPPLIFDSVSESLRLVLRPGATISPVSSAITVPRYNDDQWNVIQWPHNDLGTDLRLLMPTIAVREAIVPDVEASRAAVLVAALGFAWFTWHDAGKARKSSFLTV